jgi:uncharacterized protein YneF (UPF0154 family)
LTRFLVMGLPTFFNLLRGIVIGFFLTMALSKMSEHGAGIVAVVQTRQPGVIGLFRASVLFPEPSPAAAAAVPLCLLPLHATALLRVIVIGFFLTMTLSKAYVTFLP